MTPACCYHIETEPGRPPHPDLIDGKGRPAGEDLLRARRCKAAIVTCGGLCPGLNNVIRSVFLQLHHRYGVPTVLGIRYGYQGLNPAKGPPPLLLTPEYVERIHNQGGTVLRSSRGPEEPAVIVDYLQSEGINLLFCLGGDGTQRGTHAIAMEARRRDAKIAVVGIPKTIDNDLPFVSRSFGHGTALEKAREAINCAHTEARDAPNGIGLVQAHGPQRRLHRRRRGPGQPGGQLRAHPRGPFSAGRARRIPRRLAEADRGPAACRDRRGRRGRAALVRLRERRVRRLGQSQAAGHRRCSSATRSAQYFKAAGIPINMKYIDPSYIIRSVPANSDDSLLCDAMARHAVHAAMAGKTDVLIGMEHGQFLHIPICTAVARKKQLSPESEFWLRVIESTGQPAWV